MANSSNLLNLLNKVDQILISARTDETSNLSESNLDGVISQNITPMKNLINDFNSPPGSARLYSAGKIHSSSEAAPRGNSQSFTGSISSKKGVGERQTGLIVRREVRGENPVNSITLDSKKSFARKFNENMMPEVSDKNPGLFSSNFECLSMKSDRRPCEDSTNTVLQTVGISIQSPFKLQADSKPELDLLKEKYNQREMWFRDEIESLERNHQQQLNKCKEENLLLTEKLIDSQSIVEKYERQRNESARGERLETSIKVKDMEAKINALYCENQSLVAKIEQKDNEILGIQLKANVFEAQETSQEFKKISNLKDEKIFRLEKDIEQLKENLERAAQEGAKKTNELIKSQESKKVVFESSLKENESRIELLMNEVDSLMNRLKERDRILKEYQTKIFSLTQELERFEDPAKKFGSSSTHERAASLQFMNEELQVSLNEKEKMITELKYRLSEMLEREREHAIVKQRELCEEIERGQRLVKSKEEEMSRLFDAKFQDVRGKLETEKNDAMELLRKSEEEKFALHEKIFQLESKLEEIKGKVAEKERAFVSSRLPSAFLSGKEDDLFTRTELDRKFYEDRIRSLEGSLGLLSKEYENQKETIQRLNFELSSMAKEEIIGEDSQEMQKKLKLSLKEAESWRSKCQKLESAIGRGTKDVEFKLREYESKNNLLIKENERLLHLNKILATQQDEWRAKFLSIEKVFGESNSNEDGKLKENERRVKSLSAEKDAAERQAGALVDRVAELEREIINYKNKATSLVSNIEALEILVNEKDQRLQSLLKINAVLEDTQKQLEVDIGVLKAEVGRKENLITSLREKVENLEEKGIFRETEVKRDTAHKYEQQLSEFSRNLEKKRLRKKELKETLKKAQIALMEKTGGDFEDMKARTRLEIEAEYQIKLRSKEEEIKLDLQKIVQRYETTIEEIKVKYTNLFNQNGKDTNLANAKIAEERDYWRNMYSDSEGVIEKYTVQFKEIEEKYSAILRNSVEKFERILKERDVHIQNLALALQESEQSCREMQDEIANLKDHIAAFQSEGELKRPTAGNNEIIELHIQKMREDIQNMEQKLYKKDEEINILKKELTLRNKDLEKLMIFTMEIDRLNKVLDEKQEEINETTKAYETKIGEISKHLLESGNYSLEEKHWKEMYQNLALEYNHLEERLILDTNKYADLIRKYEEDLNRVTRNKEELEEILNEREQVYLEAQEKINILSQEFQKLAILKEENDCLRSQLELLKLNIQDNEAQTFGMSIIKKTATIKGDSESEEIKGRAQELEAGLREANQKINEYERIFNEIHGQLQTISQKDSEIEEWKVKNSKLEAMLARYTEFEKQLIEFQERFRVLLKEKCELEVLCREKDKLLNDKLLGSNPDQKTTFLIKQHEAMSAETLNLRKIIENSRSEIQTWRNKFEESSKQSEELEGKLLILGLEMERMKGGSL